MGRLDGRIAVITGAGRGIGAEIAKLMAKEGAKVVVNDLGGNTDGTGTGKIADDVVAEIRAAGGEAVSNTQSIADVKGGESLLATALDSVRRHGYPRQQRRHPARQDHLQDGRVGLGRRARRAPEGTLLLHAAVRELHPRPEPHQLPRHQFFQHVGAVRQFRSGQLRRGESRHRRLHARTRAGAREIRLHGQHDFARRDDAYDDSAARGARRKSDRRGPRKRRAAAHRAAGRLARVGGRVRRLQPDPSRRARIDRASCNSRRSSSRFKRAKARGRSPNSIVTCRSS